MRLPFAISALILTAATPPPPNIPIEVPVQLAVPSQRPMSGRLIVFAEPAKPGDKMPELGRCQSIFRNAYRYRGSRPRRPFPRTNCDG